MIGKLRIIILVMFTVLSISAVAQIETSEKITALAKDVVSGKTIDCTALSQTEIESLGDELMDGMMGSELHEVMDKRMGMNEDLMHLMMGRTLGCGSDVAFENNMMLMMKNTVRGGRMGMMGLGYGSGMMGYGWGFGFFGLVIALGLAIAVWLWVIKLWREVFGKKKK